MGPKGAMRARACQRAAKMGNRDDYSEVRGNRVLLRDARPEDVEARLRWATVEVAWQDWDAPWEGKSVTSPERVQVARRAISEDVRKPVPEPRNQLWIERIGGPLLGWVNSYHHDESDRSIWVGVNVCESAFWGQGLGTEALRLWIGHLFEHMDLRRIRVGTWSGNRRMVRCAEKCGFVLVERRRGVREVRGKQYDALELELTRREWEEQYVGGQADQR